MSIKIAEKTLEAIASTMERDQGASFREWEGRVLPHIGDAYRGHDAPFRSHMGASVIGDKCARKIWYGFRWSTVPHFKGQTLRLFNRGHLEEGRFISLLLMIGCQVFQQDGNGKQFRISHAGGHFGGSGDGVAIGIPDIPAGQPCLLEFKTHNDNSFKLLKKDGVQEAKEEHYVQMQCYMRKMQIPYALYMAVNKNNDEIHAEIIELNIEDADFFLARGEQLVSMQSPPARISESPGWFNCKWCDHKPVCHLKEVPARNCRTCYYSFCNIETGTWQCILRGTDITTEQQLLACEKYQLAEHFCR